MHAASPVHALIRSGVITFNSHQRLCKGDPQLMNRRDFFRTSAVALGGSLAGRAAENKLNFVLILMDDLGWADVGCYGSTFYETPNIDGMAARGVRFTNAYAACPVCSPSRAAIMTGKF